MSSRTRRTNEAELEKLKALGVVLPQMFSSPKVVTEGAEDVGDIDAWMMSNLPADCVLSLLGLESIGIQDDIPWLRKFVRTTLSALKGVNGYANDIGRDIAVAGFGGGRGKRVVQKRSWITRHIRDRGGPEYEELDTGEE